MELAGIECRSSRSDPRPPGGADRPLNGVLARDRTDSLGLTPLRGWREAWPSTWSAPGSPSSPPAAEPRPHGLRHPSSSS